MKCLKTLAMLMLPVSSAMAYNGVYWVDFAYDQRTVFEAGANVSIPITAKLAPGFHTVSVQVCEDGVWGVPYSTVVYVQPSIGNQVRLDVADTGEGRQISSVTGGISNALWCDVSALKPGYHALTATLRNAGTNEFLGMANAVVSIQPLGGYGIKTLLFQVGDNEQETLVFAQNPKESYCRFSSEVDVSRISYTADDYRFSLCEEQPTLNPIADLRLQAVSNMGFVVDSVRSYVDNSRAYDIQPAHLQNNVQYDLATVDDQKKQWLYMDGEKGDSIHFRARYGCNASFYDPAAKRIMDRRLTEEIDTCSFAVAATGKHYIGISNIVKSKQQFSVIYSNGKDDDTPTPGPVVEPRPVFDGIHIDWKAKDWAVRNGSLTFTNPVMSMTAAGRINASNMEVVVDANSMLTCKSDKYLKKLIFVPYDLSLPLETVLTASCGNVKVDVQNNVVTWEGMNEEVEFSYPASSKLQDLFRFCEVYVTKSDFGPEDFAAGDPADYDYNTNINCMYVTVNGDTPLKFALSANPVVVLDDSGFAVRNDEETKNLGMNPIVVAYGHEDFGGTPDITGNDTKSVIEITGDMLVFSNLPARVQIVSVSGIVYFDEYVSSEEYSMPLSSLPSGCNIVRVGNKSAKILIP